MSAEYYIIKPRTKEKFYLGRQPFYMLEGINRHDIQVAEYEHYKDVIKDIIEADCYDLDDTMEYLTTLANEIFEFVEGEQVQVVSDCDDITYWFQYKEVKCICEITRRIYGDN